MCAHTCTQARTHAMVCIWRSENELRNLVLSFYHVGPGLKLGIHPASLSPDFYKASGNLNSGPHTCKAIAVSPQVSSSILVTCLPVLSVCTQYIVTLHSCYFVLQQGLETKTFFQSCVHSVGKTLPVVLS